MPTRVMLDPVAIAPAVEAIVLSLDRPVQPSAVAAAMRSPRPKDDEGERDDAVVPREDVQAVEQAVVILNESYAREARAFRIERVAGGLRVMTLPEFAPTLAAFHRSRQGTRLSKAAVETLAIVAYRQPLTRAALEAIRGVSCGEVLKTLVERRLVTVTGRAEDLGRPLLYGTTRQFLEVFGLASLRDLPTPDELRAAAGF